MGHLGEFFAVFFIVACIKASIALLPSSVTYADGKFENIVIQIDHDAHTQSCSQFLDQLEVIIL